MNSSRPAARVTPNMQQIIDRAATSGTGRVGGLGCNRKALAALRDRGLVDPLTTDLTPAGWAQRSAG